MAGKKLMKKETLDYILKYNMLARSDRVIVGLSGGADSVCLLHVLCALKEELQIELLVVHVHHGIRAGEAQRDAEFSRDICEKLGAACEIVYADVQKEAKEAKISLEEAGRIARYRAFEEASLRWSEERGPLELSQRRPIRIAVAHHGDDNAETILHNLFRGSGLKGLGGIAPVRGQIIRPLLWASRAEILRYLNKHSLTFVEDSTNLENDYTRNRLRNTIIPLITSEINEKAVRNILRAGELMASADLFFDKRAEEWLEKWDEKNQGILPVSHLEEEETFMQGYIIRGALKRMGCPLKDITAAHVEDIASLRYKGTGKQITLPYGFGARKNYGQIELFSKKRKEAVEILPPPLKKRLIPCSGQEEIKREIPKNQYTKWFDYDKIKGMLSVRYREQGDYIMLPDGKRKTVKSFMIDEKIPASMRGSIPLLAEENHILWIIGYRISEYYKITEGTKSILEVQLDGGAEVERQD